MYQAVIIDDDAAAKHLADVLGGLPWLSVAGRACDRTAGLTLLKTLRPEVAFIDIDAPGLMELVRQARNQGLLNKLVALSAFHDFDSISEAILYDVSGYCLKPVGMETLSPCLEKIHLQLSGNSTPCAVTENKLVRVMLDYISEHFCDDVSVSEVAKHCSVNANYAGQIFKRETGETIAAHLTRLRMDKASRLLTETGENITNIAADVGFKDYFYFAKVFKHIKGQTPSGFRANNKGV